MVHETAWLFEGTEGLETTRFGCHSTLGLLEPKKDQKNTNNRHQLPDSSSTPRLKEVCILGPESEVSSTRIKLKCEATSKEWKMFIHRKNGSLPQPAGLAVGAGPFQFHQAGWVGKPWLGSQVLYSRSRRKMACAEETTDPAKET